MEYVDIKVQPLAYQDDIMKGSKDMLGAQAGNVKLATMLKDKVLSAHPDKTCYIVRGSNTLASGRLEASALATAKERVGRIRGTTMEIRSIVEKFPMQPIGGLIAARELWERDLIPGLLSGAGHCHIIWLI